VAGNAAQGPLVSVQQNTDEQQITHAGRCTLSPAPAGRARATAQGQHKNTVLALCHSQMDQIGTVAALPLTISEVQ